ncbi:MAG: DUF4399 domain-containing protein [Gammaproteobacteria bacterium]|nr:DUF4399 domain-containing protein [Gammaproteobacteria bacterium]
MRITAPLLVATMLTIILLLGACSRQEAQAPVAAEAPTGSEPQAAAIEPPKAPTRTASPAGARVFFITPADGDTVSNPVTVEFGVAGMSIVRAGDNTPASGHHHLLVDAGLPDLGLPVPADARHIHFGDASTATELTLEPGEHTLQLLLGDHLHIPHDPPVMSEIITITVE